MPEIHDRHSPNDPLPDMGLYVPFGQATGSRAPALQ